MKDRVPKYPGRVKMTPVPGQPGVYDMERADEPTEPGTPLNKASLLSSETAAVYGLGEDATPDDALRAIGEQNVPESWKGLVRDSKGTIRELVAEARYISYLREPSLGNFAVTPNGDRAIEVYYDKSTGLFVNLWKLNEFSMELLQMVEIDPERVINDITVAMTIDNDTAILAWPTLYTVCVIRYDNDDLRVVYRDDELPVPTFVANGVTYEAEYISSKKGFLRATGHDDRCICIPLFTNFYYCGLVIYDKSQSEISIKMFGSPASSRRFNTIGWWVDGKDVYFAHNYINTGSISFYKMDSENGLQYLCGLNANSGSPRCCVDVQGKVMYGIYYTNAGYTGVRYDIATKTIIDTVSLAKDPGSIVELDGTLYSTAYGEINFPGWEFTTQPTYDSLHEVISPGWTIESTYGLTIPGNVRLRNTSIRKYGMYPFYAPYQLSPIIGARVVEMGGVLSDLDF